MRVVTKPLVCALWALGAASAWSDSSVEEPPTVMIAAPSYWCPFACDDTAPGSGFAVDIARAALESGGHDVVYQNLPYDRALVEAKNGRIDGVVPAFRGETPGFIFPSQIVSMTEYCFYVSEDNPWRYHGLESLRNVRFVATSGYSYGDEMDAYIAEHRDRGVALIRGDNIPGRLRELVRRLRYDALLDDRLLFEFGQNNAGLLNAGCLAKRQAGYLALSPADPERSTAIAEAFDRGFDNIRDEGQLCRILQNYGISAEVVPGLSPDFCS